MLTHKTILSKQPPKAVSLEKIFYLPDKNFLIFDYGRFFIWNPTEQKVISLVSLSYDKGIEIVKISGSDDLFMVSGTVQYPEHNNYEAPNIAFYQRDKLLGGLSDKVEHPFLLADSHIVAVYNSSYLASILLKDFQMKTFLKLNFDVAYITKLENNKLIIIDKVGVLHLYEIKDEKLVEIKTFAGFKNILTICDLDDNHFVCSFSSDTGGSNLKVFDKTSLSSVYEIAVKDLINILVKVADSLSFFGCSKNTSSNIVYVANLATKTCKSISFEDHIQDITVVDKKLVVLRNKQPNYLIEYDLIALLKEQADQKHTQGSDVKGNDKTPGLFQSNERKVDKKDEEKTTKVKLVEASLPVLVSGKKL